MKLTIKYKTPSIPLITRTAIFSLCLASLVSTNAQARWGANELPERLYPVTSWAQNFSDTPDIVAVGSIEEAINDCDTVVGVRRYCVVEIGDQATLTPFWLSRSKTKLVGSDGMQALQSRSNQATIAIDEGVNRVVIENLTLQGHNAGNNEVYGILLYGESIKYVIIKNNRIHDFRSNANAHAVAVLGTGGSGPTAIRNIVIEGNDIQNMRTGSSESIAINGNVSRWAVTGNYLKNINNIGIDAIGGEGTAPTRILNGAVVPGIYDAARNGWITNNSVIDMSTVTNPAYGSQHSWAAAIYVDGAKHIHIQGNTVVNAPWAYEVGAENCVNSQNVTLRYNTSSDSRFGDLLLGGYSPIGYRVANSGIGCDPHSSVDDDEGHGYVRFLTIEGNDFNSSNTSEPPISIQYRTTGSLVLQEGVQPENSNGNGNARGDENAIRVSR